MTWFDAVPTLLVAVLIIFAPGAVVARTCGARGITWAGVSAPISISLIAVGAVLASTTGLRWSVWVLVGLTIIASAIAIALRLAVARFRPVPASTKPKFRAKENLPLIGAALAGVFVPAAILLVRFTRIFGHPENISQTYDNVFHLNAVRYILDTGNGSSLTIGSAEPGVPGTFYPAAWHDLVALVVESSQVSIPVGVNSVNIVIAVLVWTLSCLYLVSRVLGSRPATYLITGALAAGFSAFPYLLVYFGVLYPNFLGIALLPALIALVTDVLRLSHMSHPGTALGLTFLIGSVPGLGLTHPSVLMALGAFAIAPVLVWLYIQCVGYHRRKHSLRWLIGAFAMAIAFFVVLSKAWVTLRPSASASFWPPKQTMAQAIGEAITNAPQGRPVPYVIFALTLIGLYAILRERKHFWVLGSYAVSVLLFVAVSGFPKNDLRAYLTGVWYNDPYRLAAMLPIYALPIAAFGAVWIFDAVSQRVKTNAAFGSSKFPMLATSGVVVSLVIAFLVQGGAVGTAQRQGSNSYRISATSQLLTLDERALLERIGSEIPADATVLANPGTGASLVYALSDRRVLIPAVNSVPSENELELINGFGNLGEDPAMCSIVAELRSYFVLDFGENEVNDGHRAFPTSIEMAESPALRLIDQEGSAKLYKITACR